MTYQAEDPVWLCTVPKQGPQSLFISVKKKALFESPDVSFAVTDPKFYAGVKSNQISRWLISLSLLRSLLLRKGLINVRFSGVKPLDSTVRPNQFLRCPLGLSTGFLSRVPDYLVFSVRTGRQGSFFFYLGPILKMSSVLLRLPSTNLTSTVFAQALTQSYDNNKALMFNCKEERIKTKTQNSWTKLSAL